MEMVLAIAVAAGFLWSTVLFFAAIAVNEREQEAGFGWALAGAALYIITFSDQLPGHPTFLRAVFEILPGVSHADSRFASPIAVVGLLALAYVLRILVFYQLFIDLTDVDLDGDGQADDVNDLVAPVLSYICLSICATTAISEMYNLATGGVVAVAAAFAVAYYLPNFLRFLRPYLDVAYEVARSFAIMAVQRVGDAVVLMIVAISRFELARRGRDTATLDARATKRREASRRKSEAARERRAKAISNLAKRAAPLQRGRRISNLHTRPRNPNRR